MFERSDESRDISFSSGVSEEDNEEEIDGGKDDGNEEFVSDEVANEWEVPVRSD